MLRLNTSPRLFLPMFSKGFTAVLHFRGQDPKAQKFRTTVWKIVYKAFAFGKLFVKLFGQNLLRFGCFFQCLERVSPQFCISEARIQKRKNSVPLHLENCL